MPENSSVMCFDGSKELNEYLCHNPLCRDIGRVIYPRRREGQIFHLIATYKTKEDRWKSLETFTNLEASSRIEYHRTQMARSALRRMPTLKILREQMNKLKSEGVL